MRLVMTVFAGVLAVGLAGCVATSATRFDQRETVLATTADSIAVYRSPADVTGPYREIGLIEANGDVVSASTATFYAAMRRRAGLLGATGIILEPGLEIGQTERIVASLLDIQAERYVHAVAIIEEDRPPILAPLSPARPARQNR